jgi:hypothetical protein
MFGSKARGLLVGAMALGLAATSMVTGSTAAHAQGPFDIGGPRVRSMAFGESIIGRLRWGDAVTLGGQRADFYRFSAPAGTCVDIRMRNTPGGGRVDPLLLLRVGDVDGPVIARDDDGPFTQNARIRTFLPTSGSYAIEATTFGPGDFGNYRVSLDFC